MQQGNGETLPIWKSFSGNYGVIDLEKLCGQQNLMGCITQGVKLIKDFDFPLDSLK